MVIKKLKYNHEKYKLTNEIIVFGDRILYRIQALTDFGNVKKGDLGGFIEKEENLSQKGNCWVYDNAMVFDNTIIHDNVIIRDKAKVYSNIVIFGNTVICGNAKVKNKNDFIEFKYWWSSGKYFTWTRSNNMWKVGDFYGTGKELIEKAYKASDKSGREYERVVKYVEEIVHNNRK